MNILRLHLHLKQLWRDYYYYYHCRNKVLYGIVSELKYKSESKLRHVTLRSFKGQEMNTANEGILKEVTW